MIILDTNVVSEPLKSCSDPKVINWLDLQALETLFLTATSLSELLIGVEQLPDGRRKSALYADLVRLIDELFGPRILPFNREAAIIFASLQGRARRAGHTVSVADGQIAAIAESHGFIVATRDTAPFLRMGTRVIDPWTSPEPLS